MRSALILKIVTKLLSNSVLNLIGAFQLALAYLVLASCRIPNPWYDLYLLQFQFLPLARCSFHFYNSSFVFANPYFLDPMAYMNKVDSNPIDVPFGEIGPGPSSEIQSSSSPNANAKSFFSNSPPISLFSFLAKVN